MRIECQFLQRFRTETDGAVAVIVALTLMMLMGFVALGLDTAALYRERHKLQSVTDLAALSAVPDPANAEARVTSAKTANRVAEATTRNIVPGRYLRNPAIPPENRFSPLPGGAPGINAVSVTLQDEAPLYFAKIFTEEDSVTLSGNALASRTGAISFSLDSAIAQLDRGALNAFLSQAFQTTVLLSVNDQTVLAETTVSAGDFVQALSGIIGFSDANPAEILNGSVTPGQAIAALRQIGSGPLVTSLNALNGVTGGASIPVSDLVGGIDTDLGLTVVEFLDDLTLTGMDVLRSVATRNAARQLFEANTQMTVPGLLSHRATLITGEPPARSGWIAMGETGHTLRRADLRLSVEADLAPTLLGGLTAGAVVTRLSLPIYAEIAGAAATLDQMSCTQDAGATVAGFRTAATALHPANGTSLVALYLGTLDASDLSGVAAIDPATLGFADILDLSLTIPVPLLPDLVVGPITVQMRSHATVGQSETRRVAFTRAEIDAGETTKAFGSATLLGSGVSSLLSSDSTEIRIKPGQAGLASGLVSGLLSTVMAALPGQVAQSLVAPADSILDAVLAGTGLNLGAGELTVDAVHCERARLVQ